MLPERESAVEPAAVHDLLDMLKKLLCKDPRSRIGWKNLRTHEFWNNCNAKDHSDNANNMSSKYSFLPKQPLWQLFLEKLKPRHGKPHSISAVKGIRGKNEKQFNIQMEEVSQPKSSETLIATNLVPRALRTVDSRLSEIFQMMIVIHMRLFASSGSKQKLLDSMKTIQVYVSLDADLKMTI